MCPACKGSGRLPDGRRIVNCPWCEGTGEKLVFMPAIMASVGILPGTFIRKEA